MRKNKKLCIDMIKKVVAKKFRLKAAGFVGSKKCVLARQVVMYLASNLTDMTQKSIGEAFDMDFTDVYYAKVVIEKKMRDNAGLKIRIDKMGAELAGKVNFHDSVPGNDIQKEGPREIISTNCGAGVEDKTYYYNIIDYDGDMSDFVNLTRHKTLSGAIKEAKRFAMDRKWAGPGVSTVYAGIPPRIIRTVKFIEMSRVTVKGPMPKTPTIPEPELIIQPGEDLSLEKLMLPGKKIIKDFWDQYEIGEDKNEGKPHPPLR